MDEIDAEVLITLVEIRPVLWDKTLDVYKDRIATKMLGGKFAQHWSKILMYIKQMK